MVLYFYQIWRIYNTIVMIQGLYISYSFIKWFLSSTYWASNWILSWFENPYKNNQLEDKKIIEL